MTSMRKFVTLTIAASLAFTAPTYLNAGPVEDAGAILNQERQNAGRKALVLSPQLVQAAQDHADDMYENGYFSHRSLDGSKLSARVDRVGFSACYYAENIAQGQQSGAEVMQSWQNSSGHRKNNMSRKATHYGIGLAPGNTWVLVFAAAC